MNNVKAYAFWILYALLTCITPVDQFIVSVPHLHDVLEKNLAVLIVAYIVSGILFVYGILLIVGMHYFDDNEGERNLKIQKYPRTSAVFREFCIAIGVLVIGFVILMAVNNHTVLYWIAGCAFCGIGVYRLVVSFQKLRVSV